MGISFRRRPHGREDALASAVRGIEAGLVPRQGVAPRLATLAVLMRDRLGPDWLGGETFRARTRRLSLLYEWTSLNDLGDPYIRAVKDGMVALSSSHVRPRGFLGVVEATAAAMNALRSDESLPGNYARMLSGAIEELRAQGLIEVDPVSKSIRPAQAVNKP